MWGWGPLLLRGTSAAERSAQFLPITVGGGRCIPCPRPSCRLHVASPVSPGLQDGCLARLGGGSHFGCGSDWPGQEAGRAFASAPPRLRVGIPCGGVPMSFSSGHFEEPKSLVIQPERIMVLTDCTFSMPYSKPYNSEKQISTEKKSKNNQRAKRVSNQMQMTARGNLKFSAVCGHKTNEYQQPGKVKKEAQSTFSAQKDSILSGRGAHSSWGVCPSSCCGYVGGGFPVASLTRPHGGGFCL